MDNKYLILFGNCTLTKGVNQSIIQDLQAGTYFRIPNSLADLITLFEKDSIEAVKSKFTIEENEIIDEYIEFILKNNLGFLVEKELLPSFPKISIDWQSPFEITNSIFDYSNHNAKYFESFLTQIQQLQCEFLEMRIFNLINQSELLQILSLISESNIKGVSFYVRYNSLCKEFDYFNEIISKIKISPGYLHFIFFDCPLKFKYQDSSNEIFIETTEEHISDMHCGFISKKSFAVNIKTYTESQNFNTCLNRKISVDKKGNIKNCPSIATSYGNIKSHSLSDAIATLGFKKLWDIDKSQVSVCKTCEFRYICTDCRAYLQEPEDIYSKPLKCGYDPFTGIWEEWSTNPLSKKGIEYYNLNDTL
jgi:SPASM domain peptide maturase of grasp-with-spasm system